jgi:hypothetical protein
MGGWWLRTCGRILSWKRLWDHYFITDSRTTICIRFINGELEVLCAIAQ